MTIKELYEAIDTMKETYKFDIEKTSISIEQDLRTTNAKIRLITYDEDSDTNISLAKSIEALRKVDIRNGVRVR